MELDQIVQGAERATRRGERGANMVEYALLVALIAVVCVGALNYFGSENGSGLNRSRSCFGAAVNQQTMPGNC